MLPRNEPAKMAASIVMLISFSSPSGVGLVSMLAGRFPSPPFVLASPFVLSVLGTAGFLLAQPQNENSGDYVRGQRSKKRF